MPGTPCGVNLDINMRTLRRNDLSPRVEMVPLIDIIFLLLTFFIYSMVVMVRAEILPVTLTALGSGQRADVAQIHAVTIDSQGQLFYNRQPINPDDLQRRLEDLARQPDRPTLYVAMQNDGTTDRGPVLIRLIQQVRATGLQDFVIVGQLSEPTPSPTQAPAP